MFDTLDLFKRRKAILEAELLRNRGKVNDKTKQ